MAEFISDNLSQILIAMIIFFTVSIVIYSVRQHKKHIAEHPDDIDAEIDKMFIEPEKLTKTVRATVVDMVCYAKMIGTKRPKSIRVFTVSFKTESDEMLNINVPEEMYDGFDEGQTGVLTLIDGEIYSFEPDKSKN